jgi:hypothetical protein
MAAKDRWVLRFAQRQGRQPDAANRQGGTLGSLTAWSRLAFERA